MGELAFWGELALWGAISFSSKNLGGVSKKGELASNPEKTSGGIKVNCPP